MSGDILPRKYDFDNTRWQFEELNAENKRLREALKRASNIICDTCEDTCPCDGGESPCDETKFIEQALKGAEDA